MSKPKAVEEMEPNELTVDQLEARIKCKTHAIISGAIGYGQDESERAYADYQDARQALFAALAELARRARAGEKSETAPVHTGNPGLPSRNEASPMNQMRAEGGKR